MRYDAKPDISVESYVRGIGELALRGLISDRFRRLLTTQAIFPGRRASASQLATATGGTNWRGVNASYGGAGTQFCKVIGIPVPLREGKERGYQAWSYACDSRVDTYDWVMRDNVAAALTELGWIDADDEPATEEVSIGEFLEGNTKTITVDVRERNRFARQACIRTRGHICICCDFDFGDRYGAEFEGMIAVHHLLSMTSGVRVTNPKEDLVPVCHNCHAVMHRRRPEPFGVNDVRVMLRRAQLPDFPPAAISDTPQ